MPIPTHNSQQREQSQYLPYLDGWRGIAIILVLFGHFSAYHGLGEIGVTVFFVLSGTLMSRILFVDKTPLSVFYRRRIARIVPVLWLYLAVVFASGWAALHWFSGDELISASLFLRTYWPDDSIFRAQLPIHHLWSLNVEEHCYIFLSIISLFAVTFGNRSITLALIFSSALCLLFFVFYKYFPPRSQSPFYLRTEVAAFPLLLSCALFVLLRTVKLQVPSWAPWVSFICAFTIAGLSNSVLLTFVGLSFFLAISVNTLYTAPGWVIRILSLPPLRWFGICSYSIYIWQQPFYFLRRYTDWEYANLAGVVAAVVVASCSYYLFENPMRMWLSGRKNPPLAPTTESWADKEDFQRAEVH